jgi:glucose/arabinose dehydrogenase
VPSVPDARLTIGALAAGLVAAVAPAAQAQLAYQIPPGNPFVGTPGARGEVYAYGLRNPFRWSFDRLTGDMYVGDVGGGVSEEVTFVPRAQSAGTNFGWPCFEGNDGGPQNCTAPNAIAPAATYPETGQPVVGGYVARHPSLGPYEGRYLFGRFGGTELHVMNARGGPVAGTGLNIANLTSFGEDGIGRLYVTGIGNYVARLVYTGGGLTAEQIQGDFGQPSAVAAPYGDPDRLFIAELGGGVYLHTGGQNHLFIGLNPIVSTGGEQGLLSVAVAPDYATSGRVFVFYTDNAGNLALDEIRRSASAPNRADPASRRNIITIEHQQADNHNGGQLLFGPDGYLYLSIGDGGTQGDPEGDAQSVGSLLGKIIRINPNPSGAPAPLPPVVPADTRAPRLRVRVPRRQRVLKLRGAIAYVGCDERCTVAAGAVLRVGKRRLKMLGVRRIARASQRARRATRLKVKLRRKQVRILRRGLRRGRRASVRLTLRATDAAGNRSRLARHTIRVRRPMKARGERK